MRDTVDRTSPWRCRPSEWRPSCCPAVSVRGAHLAITPTALLSVFHSNLIHPADASKSFCWAPGQVGSSTSGTRQALHITTSSCPDILLPLSAPPCTQILFEIFFCSSTGEQTPLSLKHFRRRHWQAAPGLHGRQGGPHPFQTIRMHCTSLSASSCCCCTSGVTASCL